MNVLKGGLFATACALSLGASIAHAAEYPREPIRMVVPYTPGGGADTLGRLVADNAQAALGKTIVVENRPGANTMVATNYVANAKNDGYTVLYTSSSFTINPHLYATQYDPEKSFEPVALLSEIPLIMVTTKDSPIESLADLIERAKQRPGQISYGSYGMGSAGHLAAAQFESMAGVQMLHVPYKGSAPALADLIGGHVQVASVSLESARQMVLDGIVKPLAIYSEERLPSMPDIPTCHEVVRGCIAVGWNGVVVPKGTPQAIVQKLNDSFNVALQSPRLKEHLHAQGLEPNPRGPEALMAMIKADNERWGKLVKEADIQVQ